MALLFAGATAYAEDPAQDLLRDMHEATRSLNYDGIFVYQRGDQVDSMRLIHKFEGGTESERLVSLSGPAREVIRDGTLVTCLFADDQAAMVEKTQPHDMIGVGFSVPVEKLQGSYAFNIDGNDRVAGRAATVVNVVPASNDRYGYKLWIDDQSHLMLKSVIVGEGGRPLEQVQFTQIDVRDQIAAEALKPEIAGTGFKWQTEGEGGDTKAAPPAGAPWGVNWLPVGFEFKESNVQNMATSQTPVNHLVYSDGLAMVSVFVEALVDGEQVLQGYSSRGAVNAFSRVAGDHQITVVGEVPLATVRRIAASVTKSEK